MVETFEVASPSLRRALKSGVDRGNRMTAPEVIHLIEQVAAAGGLARLHEVRDAIRHIHLDRPRPHPSGSMRRTRAVNLDSSADHLYFALAASNMVVVSAS